MVEHCSISYFVDQHLKKGETEVKYILEDSAGRTILHGNMPHISFSEKDDLFYDLLRRLQKLEKAFGVHFSAPDTASVREQCAVSILENYLQDGGGVLSDDTENEFVYFCRHREVFEQIYQKSRKTKRK